MRTMIRNALALLLAPIFGTTCSEAARRLPPGHPAVFNDAFTDGYTTTIDSQQVTFDTQLLGTFKLPSGQLVACDPLVCDGALPFTRPVPAGESPLTLAIADFGNQRRIAFAKLAFSSEPVVQWEPALVQGQDASTLKPGEIFGYGVDAGTGSFMDLEAWRAFDARMGEDPEYSDHLVDELEKVGRPEWLLLSSGPGSVAMFSSGWGDGVYATYWGYDVAGRLAAALTDFYVVDWNPHSGDR
jgi:hypothetical protein